VNNGSEKMRHKKSSTTKSKSLSKEKTNSSVGAGDDPEITRDDGQERTVMS
jgi:hypothetical protein